MTTWPLMIDSFLLTFAFESEYPSVDQALDIIKSKIFEDYTLSVQTQPDWSIQLKDALECYNFEAKLEDEDEDPHNTNIPESEGTHDVEGPQLEIPAITEPIKIKKINIGTDTEPKFVSIGDYWDLKVNVVLWAYRTTCKKLTRHTPFNLVYGQEAIMPMEYILPSLRIA